MNKNSFIANFKRRWINGTKFNLIKNGNVYNIKNESGAFVSFQWTPAHIYISYGETPRSHTGKGIGKTLRALATMLAIQARKPIYQTGVGKGRKSNGMPISTIILREKLGWSKNNSSRQEWNSVFKVGNNNTKVRNVLKNKGLVNKNNRT